MDHEEKVRELFDEIAAGLPRFEDGRVDYREAKRSLVLTAPVVAEGKVLLLKRSDKVGSYQGVWSVNAGFIDERQPAAELAQKELREETGIGAEVVRRVVVGEPFERRDEALGVDWVTVPVLVELKRMVEPKLNWEHTEGRWIRLDELDDYELVPGMKATIRQALEF